MYTKFFDILEENTIETKSEKLLDTIRILMRISY